MFEVQGAHKSGLGDISRFRVSANSSGLSKPSYGNHSAGYGMVEPAWLVSTPLLLKPSGCEPVRWCGAQEAAQDVHRFAVLQQKHQARLNSWAQLELLDPHDSSPTAPLLDCGGLKPLTWEPRLPRSPNEAPTLTPAHLPEAPHGGSCF